MLRTIQQEHVAGTDQWPQSKVGLAGIELIRSVSEDLLDGGGVGDDDPLLGKHADGDQVAVAAAGGGEKALGVEAVAKRLPSDWSTNGRRNQRSTLPIWWAISAGGVWRATASRRRAARGLAVWAMRPIARDWRTMRSAERLRARS